MHIVTPVTIGTIGASIILLYFVLNELGRVKVESLSYNLWNALGSVLLLVYTFVIASWPFFVLNIVWLGVSLRGILRAQRHK